jgi:hypothetical protein
MRIPDRRIFIEQLIKERRHFRAGRNVEAFHPLIAVDCKPLIGGVARVAIRGGCPFSLVPPPDLLFSNHGPFRSSKNR